MTRIFLIINLIIGLILPSLVLAGTENLDEALARKARYSTNSYTNLEDPTTYIWQSETLCYTDAETGHEVWVLMHGPDMQCIYGKEYALDAWSYNGSKMGCFTAITDRTSANPSWPNSGYYKRWIVNTDGSHLTAVLGYANDGISEGGFGWAHTENAYYGVGYNSSWDAPAGELVKNVVDDDNDVTGSQLLDLNQGDSDNGWADTIKGIIKRPISMDDNWISLSSREAIDRGTTIDCYGHMRVHLKKGVSPTIEDYWGINRQIHEYYDHLQANEYKAHGGGNWAFGPEQEYMHILFTDDEHIFFQLKASGSASDGGPKWEDWNGSSYGSDEIKVMTYGDDSRGGDETPLGGYYHQYWNHPSLDVWDEYLVTGLGDTTGVNNELVGPGIAVREVATGTQKAELANDLSTHAQYDGNHHAWNGFTDYIVFFPAYIGDTASGNATIYARKVDFSDGSKGSAVAVATTHHSYDGNYNGYPRPSQSPDGTKVAFSTIWLNNSTDDYPYISYAVVEYPHPPEITQLTGTGTYTIRFDYRLDQSTSRGYSNRVWPTTGTLKPVPREVAKFRLWRSADGSAWTPVSTINANISTKFDLATNTVISGQTSYWEMTDTPGSGTWYYAVTAIEWSGLESHTVSNVYKTDGTQSAAYPSDPGGGSGVVSAYNHSLARYYNIYAEDGSTPTITQTNRVASVSVNIDYDGDGNYKFIDWLGNTNGTTRYVVTAVDSQGNESPALSCSYAHKATGATADGQYTITWSEGYAHSVLGGNSSFSNISVGASKIQFK